MVDQFITSDTKRPDEVYLVTGSHGHVGSYIVEELIKNKKNIWVICVDNFYNADIDNLKESYRWAEKNNCRIIDVTVDIVDKVRMQETFSLYRPQYVFHCASYLTLDSKENKARSVEVNTYGSALIFELCLSYDIKKVVYSSSASVYGDPDVIPTLENHSFDNCKLLYGTAKIATEFIAKSFMMEEGLSIVGLRYFNVYGPRQSLSNIYTQIVPKWISHIINNEQIVIYGDGSQTMDMIFGSDIGKANVAAMDNKKCENMFINVGTGIETSVIQLLDIITYYMKKIVGNKSIDVSYEQHDPNLVKRRCADVTLMNRFLGKHQISVKEGISLTCKELHNKIGFYQ